MVDVLVRMTDQTDGRHSHGILDVGMKLDAKFQRRNYWTMKDQCPEVFSADFDNVFSIYKFQALDITPVTQRQPA